MKQTYQLLLITHLLCSTGCAIDSGSPPLPPLADFDAAGRPDGDVPTPDAPSADAATDDDSPFVPPTGLGGSTNCGTAVGSYRGVAAYSNGTTWSTHACDEACQGDFPVPLACSAPSADGCGAAVTQRTPYGIAYQCVEYVRRYFARRYGAVLRCSGNAVDYWLAPDDIFDGRFEAGVTTTLPRPDDVVVFRGATAGSVGHIAVVRSATEERVDLIQQNVTRTEEDSSYALRVERDSLGRVRLVDDGLWLADYEAVGWLRSSAFDPLDCSSDGTCPDGYSCTAGSCTEEPLSEPCDDECATGTARCWGDSTQTCADHDDDGCTEWAAGSACVDRCTAGACCGGPGEPCCAGSTCSGDLVCKSATFSCEADTTPTATSYRFVGLCTSAHWQSTGNACFPGGSGPSQGCGSCSVTTTNPGCSSATCWRREIAFHTYAADPGYGSFSRIYHCFEGGANRYSRAGCTAYGDPTSIGWIADSPIGEWSTPLYLCEWSASGVLEHLFTFAPAECLGAGGAIVGPSPYGYVVP